MTERILKIPYLPDLAMPKYRARHGAQTLQRASCAVASLAALLDHEEGDWALLRYLYLPDHGSPQDRLRLFVRLNAGESPGDREHVTSGQHLLDEFYAVEESSAEEAMGSLDPGSGSLFLVQRAEEVFHEPENDILYFAPLPFQAGLPAVVDSMNMDVLLHSLQAPCIIDIMAKPSELTSDEGQALLLTLRELDRHASAFDPERRETGLIEDLARQRDLLAARHKDFYQQYFESLYSGRIYEFGVRIYSGDRREGALVARSLGEALTPGGRACVMERDTHASSSRKALTRCDYLVETFALSSGATCYSERLARAPEKLQVTLEEQFSRAAQLSRLCCLSDAEGMERLLQLPTSEGVYLRTIRIESEMRSVLGKDEQNAPHITVGAEAERPGEVELGLDQMQKHLFVAGVTGSGKTTTILSILTELWEKHQVPFLVLEPAKSEYRVLADGKGELAKQLRVYSPGNERLSPFRFNPLEVPAGVTVEEHISALETSFAGAIPMSGGPLPSLISEAIVACYESAGFRLGDSDTAGRQWPTMKNLVQAAGKIMASRGYVGEVKANLQTAIDVRLKSLCQRSVGRMFSFEHSFPSIDEILAHPTILEMDSLNLDQQNLLVLFLLTSIRERLTRQGPSKTLKHIIVLEEAHNLIGVQSAQGRVSGDFADPRGHAARFVVRLLAEIRAFGEGIMVVDQSPAAIAPEVLKNTSIKIVHRTVSEDDRDALAAAMLMDKYAHEELARLEVGDAFVYHERLYRPTRFRSRNATIQMSRPDDLALLSHLSSSDWFADGQCERIGRLSKKLDSLMSMLRAVLVRSIRRLDFEEMRHNQGDWQTSLLDAVTQATMKLDALVSDAMLDKTIQPAVAELHKIYKARTEELLREASVRIEERTNEPQGKE